MKKAKIVLAAVAVMGVVGTGLAFKAVKFQDPNVWYYKTVTGQEGFVAQDLHFPSFAGAVTVETSAIPSDYAPLFYTEQDITKTSTVAYELGNE